MEQNIGVHACVRGCVRACVLVVERRTVVCGVACVHACVRACVLVVECPTPVFGYSLECREKCHLYL